MNFQNLLGKKWLFFDGGLGTMLQQKGLPAGALPESWNLTHPEVVQEIHLEYLKAGCRILTTNTFGANRIKLEREGYTVSEVYCAAVNCAQQAIRKAGIDAFIAGDIGPSGKLLEPLGDYPFEDAVALFGEMAAAAEQAGADFLLIETMSDSYEAKAALLGAKEHSSLPVLLTMTFDQNGRLLTGGSILSTAVLLEALGAEAIGFNCGAGPEQMKGWLRELRPKCSLPILVQPNAGLPAVENGQTVYRVSAEEFAHQMSEIAQEGAQLLGGCCGTTPEHLRQMIAACQKASFVPAAECSDTLISSYAQVEKIGESSLAIAALTPENSDVRSALLDLDSEALLDEALDCTDEADLLLIDAFHPQLSEADSLEWMVSKLQGSLRMPLLIRAHSIEALERAMRCCHGKPLVDPVGLAMEDVFPLIVHYGGVFLLRYSVPEDEEQMRQELQQFAAQAAAHKVAEKNLAIYAASAGEEQRLLTACAKLGLAVLQEYAAE